jgi:transposase
LWIAASDLPMSPGHPFYARLNAILDAAHVGRFVEDRCASFYAPVMGRPSLTPGRYFRLLLVGYVEGIDSERGIAWRAADSLAVRSFLGLGLDAASPDHSTISRTRRLIDVETHRTVFTWVQQRLVDAKLLRGKTVGDRRHDPRSQCRHAQHRAARHGRGVRRVPDPLGGRLRDQDTDAPGARPSGPEAEEEGGEQGMAQSLRPGRPNYQDEGRSDAPGPQS